ncbi:MULTISPECIES: hypothetical protein [Pontibacillus]|uniref:Uncharacterized protein n=1 Tax=Pontibacillus chungwhensis TaxID=265426 RepID=A0ABY8UYG0_9BACI|nr:MULTISPECIES: hypothetical protein [Pontibacillus]MCD5324141.1 hypothetical protein [Pontibacillus sp. HN14]WIF97801.1 hypothetical protein QNI29_19070 [Pontibacillus chungwhensis]
MIVLYKGEYYGFFDIAKAVAGKLIDSAENTQQELHIRFILYKRFFNLTVYKGGMKVSNINKFRGLISEQGLEEGQNQDGSHFFRTEHKMENDGSIVLAVAFDSNEDMVDVFGFDVANFTDPLKKESLHKLLNEVNRVLDLTRFMRKMLE